jgi:hypothetical protein
MAKLIFSHAEILTSAGTSQTPPEYIKNITVEGVEIGLEPDTVNVEDNREIYESYTGRIVIRSKDTNFTAVGGAGATTAILDSSLVSTNGTVPTEGRLRLHGKSGSHDITTATTYIQGHHAFDSGRLETVLVAQASDVDGEVAIAVTPPA